MVGTLWAPRSGKKHTAHILVQDHLARDATSDNTRTLPASPGPDQFAGVADFAFSVPLQSNANDDPQSMSCTLVAEAADNYVRVHANRKPHVVRQTLQQLEESLSPRGFVRLHRSAIVNITRIQEIQPWFRGEYVVLMQDGTKVKSSRGRSRAVVPTSAAACPCSEPPR